MRIESDHRQSTITTMARSTQSKKIMEALQSAVRTPRREFRFFAA